MPLLLAAWLGACGGGGSAETPGPTDTPLAAPPPAPPVDTPPPPQAPGAPAVSLDHGLKKVALSWASVDGASAYRVFEDVDGTGANWTQVGGDLTGTTYAQIIPLHFRSNARYRVQACNEGGCTASAPQSVVAGLVPAVGYVKASNARNDARFGASVALSGDGRTMAVGSVGESGSSTGIDGDQTTTTESLAGAVYVYVRDDAGTWTQQAYVKAHNARAISLFGERVALSQDGHTLLVSGSGESSNATTINGNGSDQSMLLAGAAWVFVRNGATWTQEAYLKASNTQGGDRFGQAIALSGDGNIAAIGAPAEQSAAIGVNGNQNDNAASGAGAVYVFRRNAQIWSGPAYLKASNTNGADNFGRALAVNHDGTRIAAGAPAQASCSAGVGANEAGPFTCTRTGAVYVFTRTGNDWAQEVFIKASNAEPFDDFGGSTSWSPATLAFDSTGDWLVVGAPGEGSANQDDQNSNDQPGSGAAYAFQRTAGIWSQRAYLKSPTPTSGANFGIAVALNADASVLVVGARTDGNGLPGVDATGGTPVATSGAAYVFTRTDLTWSVRATLKAPVPRTSDQFGHRVAISGDGNSIAVGATYEDRLVSGIGEDPQGALGTDVGAVYLF